MVVGRVAGAAALRSRASMPPPATGGAAAVTGKLPRTGPASDPAWMITVAPTNDPVPVTRKSPAFHFAVLMVTWSTVGVTSTSSLFTPAAVVTVRRNVNPLLVMGYR